MELFHFLTNIMQNFHFKSPQSPQDINVSPKYVGFATIPPNFTMSFLPHRARVVSGQSSWADLLG